MKWIIRISNNHFPLPKLEVEAFLGEEFITWISDLIGIATAERELVDRLLKYTASVKMVLELCNYSSDVKDLLSDIRRMNICDIRNRNITSFAARFDQILQRDKSISKREVERQLGSMIVETYGYNVDLTEPDGIFHLTYFGNEYVAGWIYSAPSFDEIAARSPKESPFFGGGAMKPMLAKLLVNLSFPFATTAVDPFSGHGGILRELSAVGMYAIGVEINPKIAREAKINNHFHREFNIEVLMGDAMSLPIRRDGISHSISDPPYAKQTTTIGRDREHLVDEWLENCKQSKIIMSLPKNMKIHIPSNWRLVYEHEDYVHKSLTRVIRRLERTE